MNTVNIHEEIEYLISLRTEGDYWDFKEKWHDNNANLLHDIICMANNLVDCDGYIIIGVSDSKSAQGCQVVGVPDSNRKDQNNLIDFLKEKKFYGNIRPTVYVQTFNIENITIDVIVIKATSNTPYFLIDNYTIGKECVRSGHIYVRVGDVNTAKKAFADPDKVESLWRRRFGIDLTINQKLLQLLDYPNEWSGSIGNEGRVYHSIFPEFQVKLIPYEEGERDFSSNSIFPYLANHFSNNYYNVEKVEIFYHQTQIFKDDVISLDGGKHLIPIPESYTVYLDDIHNLNRSLSYLYFDDSNILGKLFKCLANNSKNWYGRIWCITPKDVILKFSDTYERDRFNEYVRESLPDILDEYNQILNEINFSIQELNDLKDSYLSRGNEIKTRYLYGKYKGDTTINLRNLVEGNRLIDSNY
jgi:hypothetical protein